MSEENQNTNIILQVSGGNYIKLKRVDVHADYVDAAGNPLTSDGLTDTGNDYIARRPPERDSIDTTLLNKTSRNNFLKANEV